MKILALLRAFAFALGALIDARDLMLAAGLGLIAFGAYQIYPPAAAIAPGAVLAAVAVFGTPK